MDNKLLNKFDDIFDYCFNLFKNKNNDYGLTWLLYRYQSLNDEIWRKAKRIRTLEENNDKACIPEGRDIEYIGIINYCIMFLIRLENIKGIPSISKITDEEIDFNSICDDIIYDAYQNNVTKIKDLLIKKNTDYGNAWESMSIISMTDQLIIRVYRIRKILSNDGQCTISEGITAQLNDIINYCVFALIKMKTNLFSF